jgi:hypothetical protein
VRNPEQICTGLKKQQKTIIDNAIFVILEQPFIPFNQTLSSATRALGEHGASVSASGGPNLRGLGTIFDFHWAKPQTRT